jgi:CheY-like chemotaxis protein
LIAEDNVLNQKLVCKVLSKLGYRDEDVTVAVNGSEAVELVKKVNLEASAVEEGAGGGCSVPFGLILWVREGCFSLSSTDHFANRMDLQMPLLDGIAATEAIRNLALAPSRVPKIVAMTANVLESDRRKCEEVGMVGYLSKPLKVEELVEALKKYR